jgi:four helix bundle protein
LAALVFALHSRLSAAGSGHALIARQLLRATASIGAQLEEGAAASSRRDMAAKYAIALREAREANFWARLGATDVRWAAELDPIIQETSEFVAMLTVSVKKLRIPVSTSDL